MAYLFNVFVVMNSMTLEIDEEEIFARAIRETLLDRHAQQLIAEPHRPGHKNALVHRRRVADDWPKFHPGQDVTIDIDAGRDFDKLKAVPRQLEYTALRHVEHRLPALDRVATGKRAVL